MKKHFLNEKGITLVELLAALALFAIVSTLVMTVLFNVFRSGEKLSDNAQLRQDANLLVSTLRSYYGQDDFEEDEFSVCLNNSKTLLIDGQDVSSSITGSIVGLELESGDNSISDANECMVVKTDGTPLSVNLTLENKAEQTYNLFTTIEKPEELAIQVFAAIEVPDPPYQPPRPQLDDYEPGDRCESIDKNTKYAYNNQHQFIPDNCKKAITIDGNVWFSDQYNKNVVEMKHVVDMEAGGASFNVTGNLFVDPKEFNVDNTHPMNVQGDALFNGKLQLKNEGEFIATNIHADSDHTGDGIVVRDRTRLEARESVVVETKRFHALGHGHAEIGKNLIANTAQAVNDSTINIIGSASISDKLLVKDRSVIKIGKNLIVGGDLDMSGNVEIIVDGSAKIDGNLILGGNSKLTINGSLTVNGEVTQDDGATLDVTGMTDF